MGVERLGVVSPPERTRRGEHTEQKRNVLQVYKCIMLFLENADVITNTTKNYT